MAEVKGQEHVETGPGGGSGGGHDAVMCGPPGSGKTLLARSLPGILPSLTSESLEVTKIYSVAGLLPLQHSLNSPEAVFAAPITLFLMPAWLEEGAGPSRVRSV